MENQMDTNQTPSDVEIATSNAGYEAPAPVEAPAAVEAPAKVIGLIGGGDMDASDYRDIPDNRPLAAPVNMPPDVPEVEVPVPVEASETVFPFPLPGLAPIEDMPQLTANTIGTVNPAHKFTWHGKDINGNCYVGSGDSASQCNIDAGLAGSSTCHLEQNPDYVEPLLEPIIENAPPTPSELNKFYTAGHADAMQYFLDLKTLVLAWATEQAMSGGVSDVDALPFVIYARHNP